MWKVLFSTRNFFLSVKLFQLWNGLLIHVDWLVDSGIKKERFLSYNCLKRATAKWQSYLMCTKLKIIRKEGLASGRRILDSPNQFLVANPLQLSSCIFLSRSVRIALALKSFMGSPGLLHYSMANWRNVFKQYALYLTLLSMKCNQISFWTCLTTFWRTVLSSIQTIYWTTGKQMSLCVNDFFFVPGSGWAGLSFDG